MPEEPVEILVSMAESGEIDPWNIDIVEVTDRFLGELERMKTLDLRISGRTLFFASFLLRMKSEYLEESEDDESDIIEDSFELSDDFESDPDFSFDDVSEPIERLEREIKRRIGRKGKRKSPVTLYELIKELKTAEKVERRSSRKKRAFPDVIFAASDIVSVAHEEDLQDLAVSAYACFEEMSATDEIITLSSLSSAMNMDYRAVYLPLLFLMLEGRLIIWQDEFFGDIYIDKWRADAFAE
ncbi:segregation/condensation protein A [Methanogenium sp. MK-MG]|uniref:segregation/condensation protein A n=1 Tax=Methanogenium sp. MK-MG TaxID=2599926 RepID=UPI0013EB7253|nr:ScpA family protein [Methanogenium sp. MK-MG]KAF1076659.1 Segregation and condensation protein A [Methanogenium sp. MK-MG]